MFQVMPLSTQFVVIVWNKVREIESSRYDYSSLIDLTEGLIKFLVDIFQPLAAS